jgi:hypothetical protein
LKFLSGRKRFRRRKNLLITSPEYEKFMVRAHAKSYVSRYSREIGAELYQIPRERQLTQRPQECPYKRKLPKLKPTKPCPNTSKLEWQQPGIKAVLAIHVARSPVNQFTRKRRAPDNYFRECPTEYIISSGNMRRNWGRRRGGGSEVRVRVSAREEGEKIMAGLIEP